MRYCVGCQHWDFDPGCGAYSDLTPGESWAMRCKKSHWYLCGYSTKQRDVEAAMEKAETCPDYIERPPV